MSSLSRLLSVVLIAFTVFGIANGSENVNNKASDNVINNVKITVTKNYNHYIDNNDKKELIEAPEEELANNKLLEYTGGCIGAQEVYTKKNETVFSKIYTEKKCNLSLQNESDAHQAFDLKSTNVQPLTYGSLEAGSNTTTKLNCNVEMDNLNIEQNANVIQCGKATTQHLETKPGSMLNIRGELNIGMSSNVKNSK